MEKELKWVRIAAGVSRGNTEEAWTLLLKKYLPMMYGFLPNGLPETVTDLWLSDFKLNFVRIVRSFRPFKGVKFSTYVYSCLFRQRRALLSKNFAIKRGANAVVASLNDHVDSEDGLGELLDFIVDTRSSDPELLASFSDFVVGVDAELEPEEVPVWRWLVRLGGDIRAVSESLRLPGRKVASVLRRARWVLRRNSDLRLTASELIHDFSLHHGAGELALEAGV